MSLEEKKTTVSRREFLKDAGLVVGGATIGSTAILSACSKNSSKTVTETVTKNATQTVTTTVNKEGASKFVCPVDSQEFSSMDALKAHYAAEHASNGPEQIVSFTVNDQPYTMVVKPWWPLAYVLRDILGYYGVKVGCDMGNCGTCTILVKRNGKNVPIFSCLTVAGVIDGWEITTIEGLEGGNGTLDPVQQAFYDADAYQCGYCTPGLILAAEALIADNPTPTADDVREAFSGHLCFCCNMTKQVACITGGVKK